MLRRTRLGLLDARALSAPGSEGASAVARAMAAELGWDDARAWTSAELATVAAARVAGALRGPGARRAPEPIAQPGAGARGCGVSDRELDLRGAGLREPVLMGIVNATPDSFSDSQGPKERGRAGRARPRSWPTTGPRSIDVGGESGRTDRAAVPEAEEAARVVPLVERPGGRGRHGVGGHLARRARRGRR